MAEGLASKRIARGYSLAARTGACASALAIGIEKRMAQVSPNSESNRGEFLVHEKDTAEKEVGERVEKTRSLLLALAESSDDQRRVAWLDRHLKLLSNPVP
jgi:hypothetical protein